MFYRTVVLVVLLLVLVVAPVHAEEYEWEDCPAPQDLMVNASISHKENIPRAIIDWDHGAHPSYRMMLVVVYTHHEGRLNRWMKHDYVATDRDSIFRLKLYKNYAKWYSKGERVHVLMQPVCWHDSGQTSAMTGIRYQFCLNCE